MTNLKPSACLDDALVGRYQSRPLEINVTPKNAVNFDYRFSFRTSVITLLFACINYSAVRGQTNETLVSVLEKRVNHFEAENGLTFRSESLLQDKRPDNIDPEAVRRAIRRGTDFLISRQNEDGSWPTIFFDRGVTALCTLALLESLDDPEHPAIRKGISNLLQMKREDNSATYVISLRVMALATADRSGEKYRREIAADVKWLLDQQIKKTGNNFAGGWSYGSRMGRSGDSSNSQFALLALHEASRLGIPIPNKHWKAAEEYWENCRDPRTGGFAYVPGSRGSGATHSMTCAGVASSIIIQENLFDPKNLIDGDFAKCCHPPESMEAVEQGLNWIANNYSAQQRTYAKGIFFYYMYGLERVGRMSGRRFIGPHDWYRDGTRALLRAQGRLNGSWSGQGMGENSPDVSTAFSLLFLSKGKRPVAIGHYQHGPANAADWNQHPLGVHYLTVQLEKAWQQRLNWQTIDGNVATVEDLLESPVLFISGKEQLKLGPQQEEYLKSYIENGGFLFVEACRQEGCGDVDFDQDFRQLMERMFPESELEALRPEHPIWNAHFPLLPNSERPLLGLSTCCRTAVIYCPANLSCYWQLDRPTTRSIASSALQNRIDYCTQVGVNVITYATGRQLRDKGETVKLAEGGVSLLGDRILEFPKLAHSGGADEAKTALRNLLIEGQNQGLKINLDKKIIAPDIDVLVDYPFVFMHGFSAFSFTNQQRDDLRKYLLAGGFLFADSICSSAEFTDSFRKEMRFILDKPLTPIPRDHEIWQDSSYSSRLEQVTRRVRDSQQGGFRDISQPPQLEGIELNDRLAVVFSPFDLSCAWESISSSQCEGYTNEDALKIGIRVILYSLSR